MSAPTAHRPAKGRSPSYPGIPLEVAIARARTIYDKEGRHPAPMGAITGHWGYKSPTTGPASVTYAALIKFGLLTAEGTGVDRLGRLSQLAMDILVKPNPSDEIREAALHPPIHAEMWSEYGPDLPSDENLRYRLVAQRGFTENGCQDFIRQYRDTVTFAKLASHPGREQRVAEPTTPPVPVASRAESEDDDGTPHVLMGSGSRRAGRSGANLTPFPFRSSAGCRS